MISFNLSAAKAKEYVEAIMKRDAELTDEELLKVAKLQVKEAYDEEEMDKIFLHWWAKCVKPEFAGSIDWDGFAFRCKFFDEVKSPWQRAHGPDC